MPWFHTTYRANWVPTSEDQESCRIGTYGCWLWASSKRAAKDVAAERGMGEKIDWQGNWSRRPFPRASELLMKRRRTRKHDMEIVHALCFLGQLALACGEIAAQDVIGDRGFLHEFAHHVSRKKLAEQVRRVEERIPGYLARNRKRK